ncbi:endonuclease III [Phycisphaerales bacterium AB-hyl4]|uniref:Endonuclease III n=1 Tax=Natronomicrosphaera hydrolytica TaxID=3242702 RepID=A0ABV4UBN7_9BACT
MKTPPAPTPIPLAEKRRAGRVYRKLEKTYPHATCALKHRNAFELLVATILSAQCTDERVNMTTPALFEKYPTPAALAASKPADVEKLIRSTGFYRNKAKSIRGAAQTIVDHHAGEVPDTMDELLKLPGVARKTANVVLGNAFNQNVGVVVDTHVTRLSNRLGFTTHKDAKKIERDLMPLFPRKNWTMLSHLLIFHGRAICKARKPKCESCPLLKDCPQIGVPT